MKKDSAYYTSFYVRLSEEISGLSVKPITSEMDYIDFQVQQYNSLYGSNLNGYICPECLNKNYVAINKAGYFTLKPCYHGGKQK